MKKLNYLNVLFIFALVFGGLMANAEEGSGDYDKVYKERQKIERNILKDRVERKKPLRVEDEDGKPLRPIKEEDRVKIENRIGDRKEKIDDKIEKLKEKRESLSDKWKIKAEGRLQAGIERLTKIIVRLEARIAKIDSQSGNTTRAKENIAKAKANLEQARAKIAEIKIIQNTVVDNADDSVDIEESDDIDDNEDDVNDDSKKDLGQDEMVKKIMPKAQEVQKLLKSAHKNLVDAVKALKEDNRNPKAEVKTDNNGDDSTSSDENN